MRLNERSVVVIVVVIVVVVVLQSLVPLMEDKKK